MLGNTILNDTDFSLGTEGQRPKEKLKAAGNKSPPVFLSHVNTDVSSVPPSRNSQTRSVSLASHLNPLQVAAFPFSVSLLQSFYLWPLLAKKTKI